MRINGQVGILSPGERDLIHAAMLRILDEVGLLVENDAILDRLAAVGARVRRGDQRATFPPSMVEKFLADSDKFDWASVTPKARGSACVYSGHYLNPETDEYEPWTLPRVLRYLKVAHHLKHTGYGIGICFGMEDVPRDALTPFHHYMNFKFHGRSAYTLDDARWNPCVLEMCRAAAEEGGRPFRDFFSGLVFLISPLRLAKREADTIEYWIEAGGEVAIEVMGSAGGTAPVTLAGAVAQHLAEQIAAGIVHRACFGKTRFGLGCMLSHMDMRTGMYPYGRPEKVLASLAMCDMARRYGVAYHPHGGHSDAKRPSAEAGFQKMLGVIPELLACGTGAVQCGLLSVDEIFSPIQMIIDDEIVSALQHFARQFEVSEETLAVDLVKQVGPGGQFLDAEHTARHFRSEAWEPSIFSREMYAGWKEHGSKTDVDYAREIYSDLIRRDPVPSRISDRLERRLLEIVHRHTGNRFPPIESV